jgi:hypothetical protein
MVLWAPKRSLREASCWSVDVMKGGAGVRRSGFSVSDFTVKGWSVRPAARLVASCSPRTLTSPRAESAPVSEKSRPVATGVPPRATRLAPKAWAWARKVPSRSHQVAERNFIRARSRSTIIRVATDWTRPADKRGRTFFHSTGLTS